MQIYNVNKVRSDTSQSGKARGNNGAGYWSEENMKLAESRNAVSRNIPIALNLPVVTRGVASVLDLERFHHSILPGRKYRNIYFFVNQQLS